MCKTETNFHSFFNPRLALVENFSSSLSKVAVSHKRPYVKTQSKSYIKEITNGTSTLYVTILYKTFVLRSFYLKM